MLRNLISERFKLQYHATPKEVSGYALMVARGGPKMKESADAPAPLGQDDSPKALPFQRLPAGPDGFPVMPKLSADQTGAIIRLFGGRNRVDGQRATMRDLADTLQILLGGPAVGEPRITVTDATGLPAKYDFTLTFARESTPPAETIPDIFAALPEQLGLKLDRTKSTVQVMVVDHMEKTPTGN